MKVTIGRVVAFLGICLLSACGGGGGSSGGGSSLYDGSTPTGGDSGAPTSTTTYAVALDVQRSGTSVSTFTSTETVTAIATVTNQSTGVPVEGVVVTFTQSGNAVLGLTAPSNSTLTGANGTASVDISSANSTTTGATTVVATATVGTGTYTASKAVQVSAGAAATPASISFVSVSPSDSAIVIQGSGGSGRTETATLTFKAVDANNVPVSNATVNFTVNNPSAVTLNIPSAKTNSDGLAVTTVSSKTVATTVVVTATAAAGGASSQSGNLVISNGVPIDEGFEIVAEKYNLDGRFTGDSTKITAFVVDSNGNPVADGVAVSFTTDYGAVASSTLGGCLTVNGECSVDFRVQDPRGTTGIATVKGEILVGSAPSPLTQTLKIHMAGSASSSYLATAATGTTPYTNLDMASACAADVELLLTDGSGMAPAAGTAISTGASSSGISVEIKSGTPVDDVLQAGFPAAPFVITVTADSADAQCLNTGASTGTGFFYLKFTTPNGVPFQQRVAVSYPRP